MANTEIEQVQSVLEAIKAQEADRAIQHVDKHFVQHYPYMADGVEGLKQYITGSTPEQLNFTLVCAFQDGPYVVTQLKLHSSGEDMFAVYRFQDGLIAEHWAFSAPGAPPNKSGHTQSDGPTEAKYIGETEKNMLFLRNYYETFHLFGDHAQNERFFTGDLMIRHEPGVRDGVGEFLRDVEC
jgi:predicted SnoaL-like aldol condensation-catalyzing enzyme